MKNVKYGCFVQLLRNLQILTIYLFFSTFFVEISRIITRLVLNNIVAPSLFLVILCIFINFGISNIIAVKLHKIAYYKYLLIAF